MQFQLEENVSIISTTSASTNITDLSFIETLYEPQILTNFTKESRKFNVNFEYRIDEYLDSIEVF